MLRKHDIHTHLNTFREWQNPEASTEIDHIWILTATWEKGRVKFWEQHDMVLIKLTLFGIKPNITANICNSSKWADFTDAYTNNFLLISRTIWWNDICMIVVKLKIWKHDNESDLKLWRNSGTIPKQLIFYENN